MSGIALEPALADRLGRLRFLPKGRAFREGSGRTSGRLGAGVEFEDHREYRRGDEPRTIDWAVYARLERLVTRRFRQEMEEPVIVAIDASASMALGRPSKWDHAARIGLALATIGLGGGNRVGLARFSRRLDDAKEPRRGTAHLGAIARFLDRPANGAGTEFAASLAMIADRFPGPSLFVLVTDLFGTGLADGLRVLRSRRADIVVIHVLSREENEPTLSEEEAEFRDVESGDHERIVPDEPTAIAYRRRLAAWRGRVRREVITDGGRFLETRSDDSLSRLVLTEMRRAGLVSTRR